MQIILKDKTEYEGLINSTTTEFIIVFADIDAFTEAYKKMTDDNLSELTVGDATVQNRTLAEAKTCKAAEGIEAHFVVLPTEVQAYIEQMIHGDMADKATGYDILVGEEALHGTVCR